MKSKLKYDPLDVRLAKRMYKDILALNPLHAEPDFEKWANEIRLLREAKGIDQLQIFKIWEWANKHDFWKLNILSAGKLRKQFDTLLVQKKAKEDAAKNKRVNRGVALYICKKCGNGTTHESKICARCREEI